MTLAPEYLTPIEAARYLTCSPKLLSKVRTNGTGPSFTYVGRLVRYDANELVVWAWLASAPPFDPFSILDSPIDESSPSQPLALARRFFTPADAARHLHTNVNHLAAMRSKGRGPMYFKIGGKLVRYELFVLNQWLAAQARTQTQRVAEAA